MAKGQESEQGRDGITVCALVRDRSCLRQGIAHEIMEGKFNGGRGGGRKMRGRVGGKEV